MDYGTTRDGEFTKRLAVKIRDFTQHYVQGRPTIILFPGGMGSQLFLYDETFPTPPNDSDRIWADCSFFNAGAEKIWLNADGSDALRRYIVADDAITFGLVRPYSKFRTWCRTKNINLFVFGYDWRRSAQEAATYFLATFMPALDAAIKAETGSALADYTLIGHSAGGMAVKLILNDSTHKYVTGMTRAITVATPFYGYSGQIQRFLTGILALNWNLAEPDHQNRRMSEIIATMPGGYEFLYLDHDTYMDNQAAFNSPGEQKDGYDLPAYPCMDVVPRNGPADPYHPVADGNKVRYPLAPQGLDLATLLRNGLRANKAVAQPLPDGVANKFYCIRGVQTNNSGTTRQRKTAVSSTWQRIAPGDYNPDGAHRPKLMIDTPGFGDGVQPAWTARLLQLLDKKGHVITVANGDIDHMFMMNETAVQAKLAGLMGVSQAAVIDDQAPQIKPASRDEFDDFLLDLGNEHKRRKMTPRDQLRYIRQIYTPDQWEKLALRGYIDLLKSPDPMERPARRRR